MIELNNSYFLENYSEEELKTRCGFVYCIDAVGTNRYKIGVSSNPKKRIEFLRRQSPYPLKFDYIFHTLECRLIEQEYHNFLAKNRFHGEWFERSTEANDKSHYVNYRRTSIDLKIIDDAYKFIVKFYNIIDNEKLYSLVESLYGLTVGTYTLGCGTRNFSFVIDCPSKFDDFLEHYIEYPLLGYSRFWHMIQPEGVIGTFILKIEDLFGSSFSEKEKATTLLIGWLYGQGWKTNYWWQP